MREAFLQKNFGAKALKTIEQANDIINEYQQQGFTLTLRQLYYQFVSRDLIANTQREYKNLGNVISDARLAGMIDWDAIEDRTRSLASLAAWGNPAEIVDACANQYREDLWATQKVRPEVWIEKEALVGIIERVCQTNRVSFFACRGYASQSSQYEASKRFKRYLNARQHPIILHLGDHDPSGIDMTRENAAKIELLVGQPIEVKRLALNMDQVEQYNPPPNPAKTTDSRYDGYQAEYGTDSWELDALEPQVITRLIEREIASHRIASRWADAQREEKRHKKQLEKVAAGWGNIVDYLDDNEL